MEPQADDPRAVRSRRALLAAITELLDQHEFDELSITQIVGLAGVTRPTFYQHYGDLAELAGDAVIARLDAEFSRLEPAMPHDDDWLGTVEPVVHALIEHLARHRDFYRRVLTGSGAGHAFDAAVDLVVRKILERSPLVPLVGDAGSEETRDSVVIVSGGIVWLLNKWLGTQLTGRDSVEAMAHRISVQLVRLTQAHTDADPVGPR